MPIDTGDLTDKTYKAIMIEAERFNHNLTLQFGLLSYHDEYESDFIHKSTQIIKQMLKYDEGEIDDLFFGEPPAKKEFHKALNKISTNISQLN